MNETVLIVEDVEKNMLLARDILQAHGYNVLEARNGKEGVESAIEHMPDVILMDIQMPVMNGLDAIHAIRDNPTTRDMKIIAFTASVMTAQVDEINACGVADVITKPIDVPSFCKRIAAVLAAEPKTPGDTDA